MGVGFQVGSIIDEVGTADFLSAFFYTISANLEPDGWGTRYPQLMRQLFEEGKLPAESAAQALAEVRDAREKLKALPPSKVVWDIYEPDAKPPWGDDISPDITNLSEYFLTDMGVDLFDVVIECLEALRDEGGEMSIEQV